MEKGESKQRKEYFTERQQTDERKNTSNPILAGH